MKKNLATTIQVIATCCNELLPSTQWGWGPLVGGQRGLQFEALSDEGPHVHGPHETLEEGEQLEQLPVLLVHEPGLDGNAVIELQWNVFLVFTL